MFCRFNRFLHFFRCYLTMLALVVHVLLAVCFVIVLMLGPGRSVEHAKAIGKKLKSWVDREANLQHAARERRIQELLGPSSPDVFRFQPISSGMMDSIGYGRILHVGPKAEYARPSLAAKVAKDGDVIEIEGGQYKGDTAIWMSSNLIIRGKGGVVQLDAEGVQLPENKAVWVMRGDNIRIENIEFMNARSRDRNGAGVRAEGKGLDVVSCYFHNNESGILADNNPSNWLHIKYSEFARNGHRSGQAHQIYAGQIDELIVEGCYIHETYIGSAIKSRARKSSIRYNRVVDEGRGRSNYTIDLSAGGKSFIIGNILQQGPATENYTVITYAPEGLSWQENELYINHNTIVSDREGGNFVRNHSAEKVYITNNLLIGNSTPVEGAAILVGNLVDHGKGLFGRFDESLSGLVGSRENIFVKNPGIMNRATYDYRLVPGSFAINSGQSLNLGDSNMFQPLYEYHHPLAIQPRLMEDAPDVGAFEYSP